MQVLIRSPQPGRLPTAFHTRQKPTALVRRGPAVLLSTLSTPGFVTRLEAGKRSTPARWLDAG